MSLPKVLPEAQNARHARFLPIRRPVVAQDQMTVQQKDTPMLRVSLSIILLAGWTVATPVARPAADDQVQKLTIKGSVTYQAGAPLPPGSHAVIELRHRPALPDAPAVAAQRIDLEGKQSPVAFEFTLETRQTCRDRDLLRARRHRLREARDLERRRHQD